MSAFRGILPAVVTPLNADGSLNEATYRTLLEYLYSFPIDGIYVGGQTGEGLLLSVAVRQRLTELSMKCSPAGKTVIVHAGAARAEDAIEIAQHAEKAGVHALSSLPPAGPYSFAEVRRYYEVVTSATSLPFFVYHFSAFSAAVSSVAQLLDLCSLPGVVGLKFTDYDLFTLAELKRQGATVYYGRDEMLSAGLLYGADGGIGTFYNLLPHLFTELYNLAGRGDWEATKPLQDQIQQFIRATATVPMLAGVKTILGWMGIPCGPCLAPRRGLTAAEEATLRAALMDAGLMDSVQPLKAAR